METINGPMGELAHMNEIRTKLLDADQILSQDIGMPIIDLNRQKDEKTMVLCLKCMGKTIIFSINNN